MVFAMLCAFKTTTEFGTHITYSTMSTICFTAPYGISTNKKTEAKLWSRALLKICNENYFKIQAIKMWKKQRTVQNGSQ